MTDARRQRKLYRDPNDKVIAGVASGVAKYFDVDTTLVRAIWFVFALGGFGVLLYIILWVVLEDEPASAPPAEAEAGTAWDTDEMLASEPDSDPEPSHTEEGGVHDSEEGNLGSG